MLLDDKPATGCRLTRVLTTWLPRLPEVGAWSKRAVEGAGNVDCRQPHRPRVLAVERRWDRLRLWRRPVLRVRERLKSPSGPGYLARSQLASMGMAPRGAVTRMGSPHLSNTVVVSFWTTSTGNAEPLERRYSSSAVPG